MGEGEAGLDRRIAEGLVRGDTGAWSALYEACAHQIWQQVSRMIGPKTEDVADVVQETFLAAARSANRYRPSAGTLRAWLWGIARNQVALHWRKEAQSRRLREALQKLASTDGGMTWLRSGSEPPEEVLHSQETALLVRAAMARLPEEYQGLLAAKYWDKSPTETIAREAGISESAAGSKLARARRAFRAALVKLTRQMRESRKTP